MILNKFILFSKKELKVFCTYRLLFGIFYSIMIPIIPLYLDSLGLSTIAIGSVLSFYGISKTLTQIPFGIVSDKLGDKLTLYSCLLLMSIVPFSYTVFENGQFASYIYIIQGAILGMAAPATFSILSRSLDESRRGECTGLASCVFTLGGGIGSAIGGYLVTGFNNYNLAFYISSIGILFTGLYVIFRVKSIHSMNDRNKNKSDKISFLDVFYEIKNNKLGYKIFILSSIAFLGDYIYGCVVALIHFYTQSVLNSTIAFSSAIITVYLVVFGVGAPIAGIVADKIGNKKQIFISFLVMNMTLLILGFTRSIVFFTVFIILYFLGATFLNAALQSSLSEFSSSPRIKGIVFGFVGGCESLGYALGPIFSAYIYNLNNNWLFFSLLGVSLFIFLTFMFLHKKIDL